MFRVELKLEALCESCPETFVVIHRGNEFGTDVQDDPQTIPDFQFDLEFNQGWEVEQFAYACFKYYCPSCKAKRAEIAA